MFQKFALFIIIFLVVILQLSVFPLFFPAGLVPDVALMAVVIWTMRSGFSGALGRAIIAGLLLDIFSFSPLGFSVISYVIVSYIIQWLSKRFLVSPQGWRIITVFFFIIISTIFNQVIIHFLSFGLNFLKSSEISYPTLNFASYKIIYLILFNSLAFLIIFWPIRKTEEFLSILSRGTLDERRYIRK